MFKDTKYITTSGAKTFAEKCTEGSVLLGKLMLYTSCPAYFQRKNFVYAYVEHNFKMMHVRVVCTCICSGHKF